MQGKNEYMTNELSALPHFLIRFTSGMREVRMRSFVCVLGGRKMFKKHDVIGKLLRIESTLRIFLNFLNGDANKKNVQSLEDYVRNEVYKLCSN